ncbi:type II secretion system protein [Chloroflexota bacterium]
MGIVKDKESGLGLLETILIVAVVGILLVVFYFLGWGSPGKAGPRALATDTQTIETAVGAYIINSNGLYPTIDGKIPERGKTKIIMWDASFTHNSQEWSFYPDFIKKRPGHWDEGIWRVDDVGKVKVNIDPENY